MGEKQFINKELKMRGKEKESEEVEVEVSDGERQ